MKIEDVMNKLSEDIESLLPGANSHPQPFWVLMTTKNDKPTGSVLVIDAPDSGKAMPLFISRVHAESFLLNQKGSFTENFDIYPLSQKYLRFLAGVSEEDKFKFLMFCFKDPSQPQGKGWVTRIMDGKEVTSEFLWNLD